MYLVYCVEMSLLFHFILFMNNFFGVNVVVVVGAAPALHIQSQVGEL